MKWYFALSEASIDRRDHNWRNLVFSAVRSAKANTPLIPHMLYDGNPSKFTDELQALGVRLINHRVSLYDDLARHAQGMGERGINNDQYLNIASGCFLRVDIPALEQDDHFVLYTDCDVNFLPKFTIPTATPKFFSAAPETQLGNYQNDMNSGVMLLNVHGMRDTYQEFKDYIRGNLEGKLDQEMFREFYRDKYDELAPELNWKPYWGANPEAQIVHWHGPKPVAIRRSVEQGAPTGVPIWDLLYKDSPEGYAHFLPLFDHYRDLRQPQATA